MPSFQNYGTNVSGDTDNFEPFDYDGSDDGEGFSDFGFDSSSDPFNYNKLDDDPFEFGYDTWYDKAFHEGDRTDFEPDYDFTDSFGANYEHVEHSEENQPDNDTDDDDPSNMDEFDEVNQEAEVNEFEEVDERDEIGTEEEIHLDADEFFEPFPDIDFDTTDNEFETQSNEEELQRFLLPPFEDPVFETIMADTLLPSLDDSFGFDPFDAVEAQLNVFPPLPSQASVLDDIFDEPFADLLDVGSLF